MKLAKEKFSGLTQQAVLERQATGKSNNYKPNMSKSTKTIILQNTMTLFNLLNFILAAVLISVGAYSNAFFITIILFNIFLGIVQELRAKKMVEKLNILAEKKVTVIRDSKKTTLFPSQLVLDDIILLNNGNQVPSDILVLQGSAEVNESLLTGEADAILKEKNSHLLSGSYLTSGQLIGKVEHVGIENYATKIVSEAQAEKAIKSELVASIAKISKFTSWVIIPIGIILFIEALFFHTNSFSSAVVTSVAALIGMLPKGLVLLIGIALTTGVLKLAKKEVLIQNQYAIEMIAHMDVLALDKTGTLTQGKMKVEQLYVLNDDYREELPLLIGNFLSATKDNNMTAKALKEYFQTADSYTIEDVRPFSSERKWSAVKFSDIGTLYLGSPENIMSNYPLPEVIQQSQQEGKRVLLFALTKNSQANQRQPLAFITLVDPIRENVKETLEYLKEQGVKIKVISGDNPITVSSIAKSAGVENYANFIDLSMITTESEIRKAAHNYTVFGRVTPQQKKMLINELKVAKHTVGMTGDGVNDVLALREADVSIAMVEGDGATRQISDIVLLNSDLGSLPIVISEGRRVINNITQSSGVFFIKTIYSFLLSVFCVFSATTFPFIPLQITLIDLAIEGYPSFFVSFEKNDKKIENNFLLSSFRYALPSALLVVTNIIICWLLALSGIVSISQSHSLMYFLLIGISSIGLTKSLQPISLFKLFWVITSIIGSFISVLLFHKLLSVSLLTPLSIILFLLFMILNIIAWQPIFNKIKTAKLNIFNLLK